MKYEIRMFCDNPKCTFVSDETIAFAINEDSAIEAANHLNELEEKFCPLCNNILVYYAYAHNCSNDLSDLMENK